MYFLDTYALYQIAKGAESYAFFKEHAAITTTIMNIYELYYILLKEGQETLAETFFEKLIHHCTAILPEDIKEAAKFRFKNIKKKLSYIDALGYVLSLNRRLVFVTGDDAFKGMNGVRFIK